VADPAQIAHLLRRTEYIARPARVSALAAGTLDAAVDDVLNISPTPVALPANLTYHDDDNGYDQFIFAIKWWLDRMIDSPKPMQEKMTFFWHSHFCTSWDKVGRTDAMMNQNKLFRDSALGNFRALTHAMSLQPAMLLYLDNVDNLVGDPNQNFARELMELFTMGVGNYSEEDVAAAAAAWTGHGINWDTYQYQFRSNQHDTTQKTFFGTTKNWDGPDIINEILRDNAAKKLITCKYLTKRWWEFFAYQNPSQALVDELAQVLYDNDLAIKPWVRAMLLHPEFYSTAAMQGLVMPPVEWVVSIMYFLNKRSNDVNPQWRLDGMGQVPFVPPNVSGWRPNLYWVNTSVLASRADFARSMTWPLREIAGDPHNITTRTIDDAINYVSAMFGLTLSAQTRAGLTSFLTVQRQAEPWGGWWESTNLLTMAMLTPECHMA
jgi:uncharacterized protein (DUF1800 family)